MQLRWIYEGESGYWRSLEGRFAIAPYGFRHGVTPDGYCVTDAIKTASPYERADHDTVRECKAWALDRVLFELKRDGLKIYS